MAMTLYSLGAAREVTGSKHVLEIDGRAFMIDCGAFQGSRKAADEKNRSFSFPPDELEALILTHAHYDHCGLLPVLTKGGFKGNIYATSATRDLANLIMMDSARIQAHDAAYLRKQALKKGERFDWTPLFDEHDVVRASDQIVTLSYNRRMLISDGIELEFFDAGHILGSAFAYLSISSGGRKRQGFPLPAQDNDENAVRFLFSGDLGRKKKPIIRDPETRMPAPDYIMLESTYGNRLHEKTEEAMDALAKIVRRTAERGGKIIIPSFAIERTQELVFYFHLLVDKRRIPEIPIYVDSPMAVNATSIFQIHPECYDEEIHQAFLKHHKNPFGFNALSFITSVEESKALNAKSGPMIIISADGMCEAGRVLHHLANNVGREENTVLLVGYMAEHTLGRRLRDGDKDVRIMGEWHKVRASVEQINAFSAHADYSETIEWLNELDTSRLKRIFMVHGEGEAQEAFRTHLAEAGYTDVEIVSYGERYELD